MSDIRLRRPLYQRFGVVVRLSWAEIQVGYVIDDTPRGEAVKWWLEPPHEGLELTPVEVLIVDAFVVADACWPIKPGY